MTSPSALARERASKSLRLTLGALSLWCLSQSVCAQTTNSGPELRAFVIEIILFRPLQQGELDERQWREAAAAAQAAAAAEAEAVSELASMEGQTSLGDSPPAASESEPFADGFAYLTDDVLPPVYHYEQPLPERFADMAAQTRELTPLFDRLRRSSAYEPLLHERWLQLTYPRDVANPRSIKLEREDLSVAGTVKLAVERRLHLELDLTLSQPATVDYQLQQARVMTSGEVHYIDHPAFGAICRVTPAVLPEGYPDALLADLLEDARLYAADPIRRLQSLPWPQPPMADDPPTADGSTTDEDDTSGDVNQGSP